MSIVTRTTAKSYFETNDRPTQSQFSDLIDSTIFQEDFGTFGKTFVSANTTASAQTQLGGGTVGRQIFEATTTASAQTQLGGGTVGRQIFEATTTASAQNQIGVGIISGKFAVNAAGTLTIASGVVTATASNHLLANEGAAATDDLDTINGGVDGMLLFLKSSNSGQDARLTQAGNIVNPAGINITLRTTNDEVCLKYSSSLSKWIVQYCNTTGTLGSTGFLIQSNGMIEQWGVTTEIAAGATQSPTFSIAFPTALIVGSIHLTITATTGANDSSAYPNITASSTSGFTVKNTDGDTNITLAWFAKGY